RDRELELLGEEALEPIRLARDDLEAVALRIVVGGGFERPPRESADRVEGMPRLLGDPCAQLAQARQALEVQHVPAIVLEALLASSNALVETRVLQNDGGLIGGEGEKGEISPREAGR